MQITEQEKRDAVGIELADILYRQHMILKCNETLHFTEEDAAADIFKTMAQEDEKNYRFIETAVANFGLRREPKNGTVALSDAFCETIEDHSTLPLEKLSAYLLLKQSQAMCSNMIHKAVQLSKADIKEALMPLDGVNAVLNKQIGELSSHLERTGVEWITGEAPSTGLFGRVRDAASHAMGGVLSKVAKPADEMIVLDVLKLDHRKTETLFQEIKDASNKHEAFDLYNQLKADLTAHSEAEEEVVYRHFLKIPELKRKLDDGWREHVKMRAILDSISHTRSDHTLFLSLIGDLENLVKHHVEEEEHEIFDLINQHSDPLELVRLSQEFLGQKLRVQESIRTNGINSPVSGMMKPFSAFNVDRDVASSQVSPSASVSV